MPRLRGGAKNIGRRTRKAQLVYDHRRLNRMVEEHSMDAMAESRPRKRGRPPGSRAQKPPLPPPPIPDIFIPTVFSRSGRPIKMKPLMDGTHFGLMAVKQEEVRDSPSPSLPKKPRLRKSSETRGPGRPRKSTGTTTTTTTPAPVPIVCLEEEDAGTGSPALSGGFLENEDVVIISPASPPNGYPRIAHAWSLSTDPLSFSPEKKDTETGHSAPWSLSTDPPSVSPEKKDMEMGHPAPASVCPKMKGEVNVARDICSSTEAQEENSVGDIYLLRRKPGSKLPQKRKVPSRPISEGRNTVLVKTRTPENDYLEIKIERNERRVPAKVLKEEVMKLKVKIENGEPLPPVVQKCIDQVLEEKRKAVKAERREMFDHKDRIAKELEQIYLMAECDLLIKDSLSKPEWDHSKCLNAFRKLWSVPVTRQMLYKFPKAFETARHVYTTIEGLEAELDPETVDLDEATIARHHICEAAKKVYELYSSVFPYYEDRNFWSYFKAEVQQYQEASSSMTTYDYYSSDRLPVLDEVSACKEKLEQV